MSKIEQIIAEIEEYIDSCRHQGFSGTKIIVNKEELDELLAELRLKTPDEIKKYQKIISNKDAILNDAKEKAEKILANANAQTSQLVNDHEIMQQAYVQAKEVVQNANNQAQDIVDNATTDANEIRMGAVQYTDELLSEVQKIITSTIDDLTNRYEAVMKNLNATLNVVTANRRELNPQEHITPTVDEIAGDIEKNLNQNEIEYTVPLQD